MPPGVEVRRDLVPGAKRVLTEEALAFVADLQRRFGGRQRDLLGLRDEFTEFLTLPAYALLE